MSVDQLSNFRGGIEKWLTGIPYEVAFWQSYYSNTRRRKNLFEWSNYGKPCVLDEFDIDSYIRSLGSDKPVILDVGCALSYVFGDMINGKLREIVYVDPLAPFYNAILAKHKIDRPCITFGMIESLAGSFELDTVDFIHVRNALDHCANPFEGIVQCLAVLKKGGVLYLNHFENEALNERYRGFHQYNISGCDGNFLLWNGNVRVDVTDSLKAFANVVTTKTSAGRVVSVIVKTGDVPTELFNAAELAKRSTRQLMETVQYFHSCKHDVSYQCKRAIATIGHSFMRLMPFSVLNSVKRALRLKA